MSHEHEGPGGVLEEHDREAERLAEKWKTSLDKASMGAWQAPKAKRQRLINTILQLPVNFVLTFRAKEKMKIVTGQNPEPLGWQHIGGDEYLYECTISGLLYPQADGVPSWKPSVKGERSVIKLPKYFRHLFESQPQLSEDIGEQLARWAAGAAIAPPVDFAAAYAAASTKAAYDELETKRRVAWSTATTEQKAAWRTASEAAIARIRAAATTTTSAPAAETTPASSSPATDGEPPPDVKLPTW